MFVLWIRAALADEPLAKAFIEPLRRCRHNYDIISSPEEGLRCVKSTYFEPNFVCPGGAKVNGGDSCGGVIEIDMDSVCPSGSEPSNGRCAESDYSAFVLSCPNGSTLESDGMNCIRQEEFPAFSKCDKGFNLRNGSCTKLETVKPTASCPPGSRKTRNTCRSERKIPASVSCPNGAALQNGTCVSIRRSKAKRECPLGFSLSSGSCSRLVTEEPNSICPAGSTSGGNGVCESQIETVPTIVQNGKKQIYECGPGLKLQGKDRCVGKRNTTPILRCRGGFDLTSKGCIRSETAEAIVSCEEGTLSKNGCERRLNSSPLKSCPKGSEQNDSNCLVTENVDPILNCPFGSRLSAEEVRGTLRLSGKSPNPICLSSLSKKPCYHCPGDAKVNGRMCDASISIPASRQCPSGFSEVLGAEKPCAKTTYIDSTSICPGGTVVTDHHGRSVCRRTDNSDPKVTCTEGVFVEDEGLCLMLDFMEVEVSCPEGFKVDPESGKCFTCLATEEPYVTEPLPLGPYTTTTIVATDPILIIPTLPVSTPSPIHHLKFRVQAKDANGNEVGNGLGPGPKPQRPVTLPEDLADGTSVKSGGVYGGLDLSMLRSVLGNLGLNRSDI